MRPHSNSIYSEHQDTGIVRFPEFLCMQNGDLYKGEYHKNLNCKQGWGECKYKNGSHYQGFWLNDMRHGVGSIEYSNKDKYTGNFIKNKKDGAGKYFFCSHNYEYNGFWKNNMKNGRGIETFKDGKYIGSWENGKINGDGYYKMNNNTSFKMFFANDKPLKRKAVDPKSVNWIKEMDIFAISENLNEITNSDHLMQQPNLPEMKPQHTRGRSEAIHPFNSKNPRMEALAPFSQPTQNLQDANICQPQNENPNQYHIPGIRRVDSTQQNNITNPNDPQNQNIPEKHMLLDKNVQDYNQKVQRHQQKRVTVPASYNQDYEHNMNQLTFSMPPEICNNPYAIYEYQNEDEQQNNEPKQSMDNEKNPLIDMYNFGNLNKITDRFAGVPDNNDGGRDRGITYSVTKGDVQKAVDSNNGGRDRGITYSVIKDDVQKTVDGNDGGRDRGITYSVIKGDVQKTVDGNDGGLERGMTYSTIKDDTQKAVDNNNGGKERKITYTSNPGDLSTVLKDFKGLNLDNNPSINEPVLFHSYAVQPNQNNNQQNFKNSYTMEINHRNTFGPHTDENDADPYSMINNDPYTQAQSMNISYSQQQFDNKDTLDPYSNLQHDPYSQAQVMNNSNHNNKNTLDPYSQAQGINTSNNNNNTLGTYSNLHNDPYSQAQSIDVSNSNNEKILDPYGGYQHAIGTQQPQNMNISYSQPKYDNKNADNSYASYGKPQEQFNNSYGDYEKFQNESPRMKISSSSGSISQNNKKQIANQY